MVSCSLVLLFSPMSEKDSLVLLLPLSSEMLFNSMLYFGYSVLLLSSEMLLNSMLYFGYVVLTS